MIYICDMLKQCLLRLLKEDHLEDEISLSYFELLRIMLEKSFESKQKDVSEFVMTCMGMVVVHHYGFKPKTWDYILEIFNEYGEQFKYQTGLIIKKIISEKVRNLDHNVQLIIGICLKQISPSEQKISNEALWSAKSLIDMKISPLY